MIDSHAHVASAKFDADRQEVAARARAAGIRWIEIGTDVAKSERALKVAAEFPADIIGATVGVHPSDVQKLSETDWEVLTQFLVHEQVVAVGEVGLDYHHSFNRDEQLTALKRFVELANNKDLPIVFHVRSGNERDAHEDMLSFLEKLPTRPRGVMHTFSGTWQQAERYLKLGLYLSLSGVVTFKNAPDMHEVARQAPLDRLLIETDCPYLTPEPYRGQRNEPAYVAHVAEKIAAFRNISVDDVAITTQANTLALFQ